jgi:hypothetical protein
MKIWQYVRGLWDQIEDPFAWPEGEDWERVYQRLGYGSPSQWGGEEAFYRPSLGVHERGRAPTSFTDRFPYLLDVSVSGESSVFVLIPDFPSLLLFLREYGPVFESARTGGYLEELHEMASKIFRAEHGHSFSDVCLSCDPDRYTAQIEAVRRARERRKAQAPDELP